MSTMDLVMILCSVVILFSLVIIAIAVRDIVKQERWFKDYKRLWEK